MDKGKEGEGPAKVDKKFLNVNIINFAEVDKRGGKTLIHQKWIICLFFKTFPLLA